MSVPGSRFEGRVAVVTGASGAIGASIAHILRDEGAIVHRWDVVGDPDVRRVDVGDHGAVQHAVASLPEAPDLLVHAAGVHHSGSALSASDKDMAELLRINVLGTAHVVGEVGASMKARGTGAIVAIASDAAVVPRPSMAFYGASKAAALQLTLAAALELASAGVRCNVVCPGATDTAMQRKLWAAGSPPPHVVEGDLALFRTAIPLQKIATPLDVAEMAAFLLSNAAGHITAQKFLIDGGASLGR